MKESSIKCSKCEKWNKSNQDNINQHCKHCGSELNPSHKKVVYDGNNDSFLNSLPPYAKYIFLTIVSIIGGIIVFALA
jgi:PHP family Zn ribbon phosphoesterase